MRKDPDEIRWLRAHLDVGDLAIDAGAYKGGYTYWMRHEVGPSGAVYAFEPQPDSADFLRRTVGAFDWDNVHVQEAALSGEEGGALLHAPGEGPSQRASLVWEREGARSYPVRCLELDRFVEGLPKRQRISLIKCDVEGHEMDVFRGARTTLERDRPALLFECEARHDPDRGVGDVFDYLQSLGYRGSFFLGGKARPVSAFDPERHQTPGSRPYVNNFVFEIGQPVTV